MNNANALPKSVFLWSFSCWLAVLAADFLFVYIHLSGWVLQVILVSIYFEYLGLKKTMLVIGILETFFMPSYGGATTVSAILSGPQFFMPKGSIFCDD